MQFVVSETIEWFFLLVAGKSGMWNVLRHCDNPIVRATFCVTLSSIIASSLTLSAWSLAATKMNTNCINLFLSEAAKVLLCLWSARRLERVEWILYRKVLRLDANRQCDGRLSLSSQGDTQSGKCIQSLSDLMERRTPPDFETSGSCPSPSNY